MRIRATITQTIDIEIPDQDFEAYRQEKLGDICQRYDEEEAHCSGTPEEILITSIEGVLGDAHYTASTINISLVE